MNMCGRLRGHVLCRQASVLFIRFNVQAMAFRGGGGICFPTKFFPRGGGVIGGGGVNGGGGINGGGV